MLKLLKRKTKVEDLVTIEELKNTNIKLNCTSMNDKKQNRILFLDDEGYDTESLENLGYLDIDKKDKYSKMADFENYDIIFCDINGIAKELDEVYQGAALAKLIKETYPLKIVVIFSAKNQTFEFNKYNDYVDDIIYKNISPSEMAEKINKYIKELTNPVDYWERVKKQLIRQNINVIEIAKLENKFVRSIKQNKDYTSDIKKIGDSFNSSVAIAVVEGIIQIILIYLKAKQGA